MWVKICGITRLEDAVAASRFGADAIGFVFAESPRKISPLAAKEISEAIPSDVSRVGVFVDRPVGEVLEIAELCGLDTVQLHGHEDEGYRAAIDRTLIKAVRVADNSDILKAGCYPCDALLLDGYCGDNGGVSAVDWSAVRLLPPEKHVIIAGGLSHENVAGAIKRVMPYGVDVSSGVESAPGVKDHVLIYRFIEQARKMDYEVNGN